MNIVSLARLQGTHTSEMRFLKPGFFLGIPLVSRTAAMPGNRTALMLVDIQYDFLPPNGSLAVANGADILPTVYDLLDHTHFDAYFASQDYHPVGHVSFASAHPGTKPYTSIQVPKLYSSETVEQMLWPDHCVQGTRVGRLECSSLNFVLIDLVTGV
ncbi:Isochorismatase domain-containing protein [Rhizoctonia solani AG-1 IA]|uniref:Isochorismatase domain-containing protein n=1 Tax=Thanatephorus cucumeris (strain AG1-IA) TaxID=983506 RepID=L8X965_THACA|nr:Isochorismatase domain-containing protein [Rhizoctonia solani AG-1 IA]